MVPAGRGCPSLHPEPRQRWAARRQSPPPPPRPPPGLPCPSLWHMHPAASTRKLGPFPTATQHGSVLALLHSHTHRHTHTHAAWCTLAARAPRDGAGDVLANPADARWQQTPGHTEGARERQKWGCSSCTPPLQYKDTSPLGKPAPVPPRPPTFVHVACNSQRDHVKPSGFRYKFWHRIKTTPCKMRTKRALPPPHAPTLLKYF